MQAGDEFGISVGMYDRYATVGVWKEDDPNNAGADIYLMFLNYKVELDV